MRFQYAQSDLQRPRTRPSLALVLFVLWILFIIYGTTLPFDFSGSGHMAWTRFRALVRNPIQRGGMTADAVSNVLLFVPFGFLLSSWRSGGRSSAVASVLFATASGAFLSGFVEFAQLYSPKRTPSFIDLATNTTGATLGAIIGWLWARWLWPIWSIRIRQLLVARPLQACALAAALGFVVAGLFPLPVELSRESPGAAVKTVRFVPFGRPWQGPMPPLKPWVRIRDLVTWALGGGIFLLAARQSGLSGMRGPLVAIAAAGGLCLAIECLHIVVPGRAVDMTTVLLAVAGSAIASAALAGSAAGDAGRLVAPALVLWCLVIMLTALSPWSFAWPSPPYVRPERLVPFWSYFFSRSLGDLADVIGQALIFLPLGMLLAARSWRQSLLGAILIGLGLSLALECGQAFVPGRVSDISDVLSAGAGTAVGLGLWRWAESARTSSQGVARYRINPRTGLFG